MTDSQKRKAALAAMDAYKAHASNQFQQIADEAAAMMQRFGAVPSTYPATAEFLRLRDIADTLRREVQP
jgi:regulator of protease activity HflC (stomatin/prohibitin superfamily)